MPLVRSVPLSPLPYKAQLAVFLFAALLAVSVTAEGRKERAKDPDQAAPISVEAQAKAAPLIESATAAKEARDFAGAYRGLAAAYKLAPTPQVLYQLGALAHAEGRAADAYDLMRRYLAEVGSDGAPPLATTVLRGGRPQSGEVSVIGDRGSIVSVADRVVGMLPLAQPLVLTPGTHRIVVELGPRRQEDQIKVLAGRLAEMQFNVSSEVVVVTMEPAVLLLSNYQKVPPELQAEMERSVEKSLRQQRLGLQTRAAALVQAPELDSCLDERRCQLDLAQKNLDPYLMVLRVDGPPKPGEAYQVNLELLDVGIGDRAASWERICPRCSNEQAVNAVADAALRTLQQGRGRPRAPLSVRSTPPGAEVLLAGRSIGHTPLKRLVWAGSYQLVLRAEGFADEAQILKVDPGQRPTIEVTLTPGKAGAVELVSADPAARGKRPRWRLITGAVAVGVGAMLTGFGISALTVKDQCRDESPVGICRSLYDTGGIGGGLLGAGLAITIGGVVLLALPGPK